MQISDICEYQ